LEFTILAKSKADAPFTQNITKNASFDLSAITPEYPLFSQLLAHAMGGLK
jgi:hypothetical protein